MITSVAIVRGLPRPLAEGPLYEALRLDVHRNGQSLPVLVDREGVCWGNRTLLNVLLDLGLVPWVKEVESGFEAAVAELATRDLTLLERTDLVARVYEEVSSAETALQGKASEAVSDWFAVKLGKVRGFKPRKCEYYQQLARVEPYLKKQVAHLSTPEAALELLELKPQRQLREPRSAQPRDEDDSLPVQIERLTTAIFSARVIDNDTKDLLRMLRVAVEEVLMDQEHHEIS